MTACDLCASDASRFDMNRKCCQLRQILNMPRDRRESYYQRVISEQGREAAKALVIEVNALRRAKRAQQEEK